MERALVPLMLIALLAIQAHLVPSCPRAGGAVSHGAHGAHGADGAGADERLGMGHADQGEPSGGGRAGEAAPPHGHQEAPSDGASGSDDGGQGPWVPGGCGAVMACGLAAPAPSFGVVRVLPAVVRATTSLPVVLVSLPATALEPPPPRA